ncbi:MAG: hypothetical protein EKK42_20305 [Pseudonocardiaceae bacterium]|nr:MAG: hypothetical protein EKK42_20305 [Pseudonocardiaceae bacterium]
MLPEDRHVGCAFAGPAPTILAPDAVLAVGFGFVTVKRDGEVLWSGDDETKRLSEFDVSEFPDSDWRVEFLAPLTESEYQWHPGTGWVLFRTGLGFA